MRSADRPSDLRQDWWDRMRPDLLDELLENLYDSPIDDDVQQDGDHDDHSS